MAKTSKDVPASCGQSPEKERQWQAEDDARTLERAEEVYSDADRAKRAAKVVQDKAEATSKVADRLAKRGLISDKQRAKMKGKSNG